MWRHAVQRRDAATRALAISPSWGTQLGKQRREVQGVGFITACGDFITACGDFSHIGLLWPPNCNAAVWLHTQGTVVFLTQSCLQCLVRALASACADGPASHNALGLWVGVLPARLKSVGAVACLQLQESCHFWTFLTALCCVVSRMMRSTFIVCSLPVVLHQLCRGVWHHLHGMLQTVSNICQRLMQADFQAAHNCSHGTCWHAAAAQHCALPSQLQ